MKTLRLVDRVVDACVSIVMIAVTVGIASLVLWAEFILAARFR